MSGVGSCLIQPHRGEAAGLEPGAAVGDGGDVRDAAGGALHGREAPLVRQHHPAVPPREDALPRPVHRVPLVRLRFAPRANHNAACSGCSRILTSIRPRCPGIFPPLYVAPPRGIGFT